MQALNEAARQFADQSPTKPLDSTTLHQHLPGKTSSPTTASQSTPQNKPPAITLAPPFLRTEDLCDLLDCNRVTISRYLGKGHITPLYKKHAFDHLCNTICMLDNITATTNPTSQSPYRASINTTLKYTLQQLSNQRTRLYSPLRFVAFLNANLLDYNNRFLHAAIKEEVYLFMSLSTDFSVSYTKLARTVQSKIVLPYNSTGPNAVDLGDTQAFIEKTLSAAREELAKHRNHPSLDAAIVDIRNAKPNCPYLTLAKDMQFRHVTYQYIMGHGVNA
jgi:hypothetical protein